MENKRYQGDNLDGAISEACAELGIPSDKLRYKVVQEGSKGLFGLGIIGAKKFIIEIIDNNSEAAKSEKKPSVHAEKPNRDRTERSKTEKPKADNSQNDNNRRPVKTENVDNSEKNQAKSEQKQPDRRNNNKDRIKDRPRRFDKEQQAVNSAEQRPNGRSDRRDAEPRRKFSAEPANNAAAVKPELRTDNRSEQPAARRYEKTGEVTGDPVKTAEEFLTSLFKSMEMNISYSGELKNDNNELIVNLSGEDMGVLIGKRGQTLDALQYLTSQVVNKHQTAYIRVKIDTENYRERRKETMESLAQNIALKVKKTHKPVALEPMNPYERRIIHSYLQNDKEIVTKSEGVEPYRHVIVCPVKKKKSYGPRSRETVINEEAENFELKITETIINTEAACELKVNDEQTVIAAESKLTYTETELNEVKLEAVSNDNSSDRETAAASFDKLSDKAETSENKAKTEE